MTADPNERSSDAPAHGLSLTLTVTVDGDLDRVFNAFSDPADVSRWFTTRHEATVKVGGEYRNADGDRGRYLAVEPPDLLEFTWENATHCPDTSVRVSFRESDGRGVVVKLVHSGLATRRDVEDMTAGWSWALDSFKSYVESGKPIAHSEWLRARGGE